MVVMRKPELKRSPKSLSTISSFLLGREVIVPIAKITAKNQNSIIVQSFQKLDLNLHEIQDLLIYQILFLLYL